MLPFDPNRAGLVFPETGRRRDPPPDEELPVIRKKGKSTRIRVGDGPDEIVDPPRGPVPVDPAVFGSPPPVVAALREVLESESFPAFSNQGQKLVQENSGLAAEFPVERPGGIRLVDCDGTLPHDAAGIGFFRHEVQRDPRPLLAVDKDPVHGRPAPVGGQQRSVEIEGLPRREIQDLPAEHPAIVEGKERLRPEGGDPGDLHGNIYIGGAEDGDPRGPPPFLHGTEPAIFPGIVIMGKDRGDFETVSPQRLQSGDSHVVVGKGDNPHARGSGTDSWTRSIVNSGRFRTSR